jgi:hypothetical protein
MAFATPQTGPGFLLRSRACSSNVGVSSATSVSSYRFGGRIGPRTFLTASLICRSFCTESRGPGEAQVQTHSTMPSVVIRHVGECW